ncbi:hypothetical protein RSO01_36100 [Reyranella soli]|uniref:Uncharacterized protein n=2 Tax=Reyranella soli TaxID=1230389 RepID=A0A512NBY0_9HYPH|nr:hypothetical protein RSO01_36100 [Reyranella soli]
MNHWPVRLLVVLTGIVVSDATVHWTATHHTIHDYYLTIKEHNIFGELCRISLWFLRGIFIAIFFARYLPRMIVIFLLVFSCASYAIFLMGHFPAFHAELRGYRDVVAAAPVFILVNLPVGYIAIDYGLLPLKIYSPLVLLISFFLRHVISILIISFLYELAFGARKTRPS